MSDAHDVQVDDRLTFDQLVALQAVRLPRVTDRTFDDVAVIRIDEPSIDVIEDVRG
jgi:hypothetical protein